MSVTIDCYRYVLLRCRTITCDYYRLMSLTVDCYRHVLLRGELLLAIIIDCLLLVIVIVACSYEASCYLCDYFRL